MFDQPTLLRQSGISDSSFICSSAYACHAQVFSVTASVTYLCQRETKHCTSSIKKHILAHTTILMHEVSEFLAQKCCIISQNSILIKVELGIIHLRQTDSTLNGTR